VGTEERRGSDGAINEQRDLRRNHGKFRKTLKVVYIESIDSLHAISLHRCDDLQIEYVGANHRVVAQQPQQDRCGMGRHRQYLKKMEQARNAS